MSAEIVHSEAPAPKAIATRQAGKPTQEQEGNTYRPARSIGIQPKLTVGAPDDPYEREADAVADKVMRMPEPTTVRRQERPDEEMVQTKPFTYSRIQRACAECEKEKLRRSEADEQEETVQPKRMPGASFIQLKCATCDEEQLHRSEDPASEDENFIQAKSIGRKLIQRECDCEKQEPVPLPAPTYPAVQTKRVSPRIPVVSDSLHRSIQASRNGGARLDARTSRFMSERMGADFSQVRIHSDQRSAQQNQQLNAKAFTLGSDIFFNEGQYQPNTQDGKKLLAHELTHVVQQGHAATVQPTLMRKEAAPSLQSASVCTAPALAEAPAQQPGAENSPGVPSANKQPAVAPPPPSPPAGRLPAGASNTGAPPAPAGTGEADTVKTTNAPQDDPAFKQLVKDTRRQAKGQKNHELPEAKTGEAANAVSVDGTEALDKGAAVLTVQDNVAKAPDASKEFNAQRFKDDLKQKITNQVPHEEGEVRNFIKDESKVNGIVDDTKQGIKQAEQTVTSQARAISDTSQTNSSRKGEIKQGAGIGYTPEQAGARPYVGDAARAVPKALPDDEVVMDDARDADSLDRGMKQKNLTDEQLAESDEPQFKEGLATKQESQQQLCKVPAQLRSAEAAQLQSDTKAAAGDIHGTMTGMHGNRDGAFGDVAKGQGKAQSESEKRLAKYYGQVKAIYEATETNVKQTLTLLECMVTCTFQDAIDAAFKVFQSNVSSRLDYYYDWHIINPDYEKQDKMTSAYVNADADGKIANLKLRRNFYPEGDPKRAAIDADIARLRASRQELIIEKIFREEKATFISSLDIAIDSIADLIDKGLGEARSHIDKGKAAMDTEYNGLDKKEQEAAGEITGEFRSKYEDLETSVKDKEGELSDNLAKQYSESVSKLKDKFEEIRKEAATTWWEKAWQKIKEIATIIFDIGKLLLNVLVKAAGVIGDIIAHPIRFFGNLIEGVSTGFTNFVKRLPQHLENIMFKLIMGVVPPNITLPEKWDAAGIFSFVLDFFGLSKQNIREQAVKRFGEPVVTKLEEGFELFVLFRDKGFSGLWEHVKEKIGDLKDAIIEEVKTFFKESIIKMAIEFLLSALTPASGFIKVCKSIISVVMFFIKNLQNILKLLESILDSISDIALGKIDKAAAKVESALADILLIGIKFLAALVGINLDKIQAKISKVINAVRSPVNRAINWFFNKAEAFAKKTGLLKLVEKGKTKVDSGKKWAKDKAQQAKEKTVEVVKSLMNWLGFSKEFKSKDGGRHKIYFKGKTTRAVMMMASEPTPVEKVLIGVKATDPNAEVAYKYYLNPVKVTEAEVEKLEGMYKSEPEKKQKRKLEYAHETKVVQFRKEMWTFAEYLSAVSFKGTSAPEATTRTKITSHSVDGRPTLVKAYPLTYLPGDEPGSSPVEDALGWRNYAQRNSDTWVNGHLISEHLHGPGKKWNLVPVNKSMNKKMEQVETKARKELKDQTKQLFYETDLDYDTSRQDANAINIPVRVQIRWGFLEASGTSPGQYTKHPEQGMDHTDTSLPLLGGVPNLNVVPATSLMNFGINNRRLADNIVDCRDGFEETKNGFADLNDLIARMNLYCAGKLTRKPGLLDKPRLSQLSPAHIDLIRQAVVVAKTLQIAPR